jgi:hypothetical protein
MSSHEPSDEEVDALEAELRADIAAHLVDLAVLQEQAKYEPPVELGLAALWQQQTRQLGDLLGKPDDTWGISKLQ